MLYYLYMNLVHHKGAHRFLRYLTVGISTFLFDMLLIWIATSLFGVPYYISTPVAFWIALTINYALSRKYVFTGTERRVHHGYAFYIAGGIFGGLLITSAVAFLVEGLGLHYLIARCLVSACVGLGGYIFNLYINFKVAGQHH